MFVHYTNNIRIIYYRYENIIYIYMYVYIYMHADWYFNTYGSNTYVQYL